MPSAHRLSMYLKDWDEFYDYLSTYGAHIALWAILSAVTVFRREISCNRSYHEDDEGDTNNHRMIDDERSQIAGQKMIVSIDNEEKELMTEELLDGAGLYCSGKPLLNFATLLRLGFDNDYRTGNEKINMNGFSAEDLLDRVGNYATPEPIIATIAFFMVWKKTQGLDISEPLSSPLCTPPLPSSRYGNDGCDPLGRLLPPDVHVQIASFLHPRDVVTLSCVSKAYHCITDDPNNETSAAIWKTLWDRDFSWIVFKWKIGKEALQRSKCKQWTFSKDFYFLFEQSYLDYVLAAIQDLPTLLWSTAAAMQQVFLMIWVIPSELGD
ncbi:unnamed protein product [Pseudo-nitzschia multistriata]|uniref:F-box domain-containing protein n=1 Tax=Pseudo-nitzschia multistriata TaxID=183589 RepID=A0A448Z4Q7_9STRA|nr:unnamed protein product [Pseudo-nitzschia multistriata]